MSKLTTAMLIVASLVFVGVAHAADPQAYKLQLQADPDLPNGKVRVIEGTADPVGDRFFTEAGILQPIAVTLIAQKKGDAIDIAFGQDRWDEKLKTATTGPAGEVTVKLRTQGELRMTITAAGEPKPYWLIVWVGDEVKPQLASVMTPMKKSGKAPAAPPAAEAKAGGGSGAVLYVIAGALIVIAVLLVLVLVRKRGRA